MADLSLSHRRHHEYSYRLPTPPRIVVPPPTLTAEMPELSVGRAGTPADELDTSFLRELSLDSIVQKNTLLEWAYERRRQAQLILPWLYLGPLTTAKDVDFLAREGITMVLAIRARENSMKGALQVAREACHDVATIEAPTYYALVGNFPIATRMINQHVAKIRRLSAAAGKPQLGKVLVFCESGNEKSAAVVAAYLMEMLDDFDHIKAMQVCQAQRFCVNFDDTIKLVLRSHWDILLAKRSLCVARDDAHHLAAPTPTGSRSRAKRSIEDTRDDEDIEMGDDMDPSDALRFVGRDITPFRNS